MKDSEKQKAGTTGLEKAKEGMSEAEALRAQAQAQKEEAEKKLKDAAKAARKEMDPLKDASGENVKKAFSFMEKEKFDEKKIEEMIGLSEKMGVYDLWRGGISRMRNEEGLKDNQGFDRMAAQFSMQKVDERGRAYLEINLHGKSKFEMHIGAGHICPPSWVKVAIVDKSGNMKTGTRKVPGKDNVDGHKVGYYDENGEYLTVFSGYKVYPLSVLSEEEANDKKVIDQQVEKEGEFYTKNKKKLEEYADESVSYGVGQMEMSPSEIQRIRDKIPGLEDEKNPGERVAKVAKYIAENEKIYAKHCGNWVTRVYLIAGVTKKNDTYRNLDYAKGPDGKLGASRDARDGKHAIKERPDLVDNLEPGTWLWINNRNQFDIAGNHSVIFVGWKDKANRIAFCANWLNPSAKGQKISTIDFNKVPIVSITRPTEVESKFTRVQAAEATAPSSAPAVAPSSTRVSTSEAYENAKQSMSGSDKSELAARGITPFTVRMGYELTTEERTIYDRERKEAYRIGRMDINTRLEIMQQRYKLRDAIELSFRALKMQERHRAYFYAYNDAVMRIESNYNPLCVNMREGKVALSTASGAYQILNSTWADLQKRLFGNTREAEARRRSYGNSVDFDLLKDVNFNASLPGEVTPYEQAIFHNIYVFNGARVTSGVMAFDNVFDKLQSGQLSPEMQYSYQAYLYTNWRNGLGGAKVFLQMANRGIPFPKWGNTNTQLSEARAREYFDQMPDCWQKRRGFGDFRTLVRACSVFVERFNKNLREMGAA